VTASCQERAEAGGTTYGRPRRDRRFQHIGTVVRMHETPGSAIELRRASTDELADVARIHAAEIPHGFLGEAGEAVLQPYWRGFVESPHAVAIVARADGEIVGMLGGTLRNRRHWRWFARYGAWRLAVALVVTFVRSPRFLWRFMRTRLGRYVSALWRLLRDGTRRSGGEPEGRRERTVAVLSHMAVTPAFQSRGVGHRLVDEFVGEVRAAGITSIHVLTLDDENGAGGFYDALGGERREVHERDGDTFRRYELRLDPEGP
jgi:ribosomal protein S18 acetylase RimI-like enzyme